MLSDSFGTSVDYIHQMIIGLMDPGNYQNNYYADSFLGAMYSTVRCCGADGYEDYSELFNISPPEECIDDKSAGGLYYDRGCAEQFSKWLKIWSGTMSAALVIVSGFEIWAMVLCRQLIKAYKKSEIEPIRATASLQSFAFPPLPPEPPQRSSSFHRSPSVTFASEDHRMPPMPRSTSLHQQHVPTPPVTKRHQERVQKKASLHEEPVLEPLIPNMRQEDSDSDPPPVLPRSYRSKNGNFQTTAPVTQKKSILKNSSSNLLKDKDKTSGDESQQFNNINNGRVSARRYQQSPKPVRRSSRAKMNPVNSSRDDLMEGNMSRSLSRSRESIITEDNFRGSQRSLGLEGSRKNSKIKSMLPPSPGQRRRSFSRSRDAINESQTSLNEVPRNKSKIKSMLPSSPGQRRRSFSRSRETLNADENFRASQTSLNESFRKKSKIRSMLPPTQAERRRRSLSMSRDGINMHQEQEKQVHYEDEDFEEEPPKKTSLFKNMFPEQSPSAQRRRRRSMSRSREALQQLEPDQQHQSRGRTRHRNSLSRSREALQHHETEYPHDEEPERRQRPHRSGLSRSRDALQQTEPKQDHLKNKPKKKAHFSRSTEALEQFEEPDQTQRWPERESSSQDEPIRERKRKPFFGKMFKPKKQHHQRDRSSSGSNTDKSQDDYDSDADDNREPINSKKMVIQAQIERQPEISYGNLPSHKRFDLPAARSSSKPDSSSISPSERSTVKVASTTPTSGIFTDSSNSRQQHLTKAQSDHNIQAKPRQKLLKSSRSRSRENLTRNEHHYEKIKGSSTSEDEETDARSRRGKARKSHQSKKKTKVYQFPLPEFQHKSRNQAISPNIGDSVDSNSSHIRDGRTLFETSV